MCGLASVLKVALTSVQFKMTLLHYRNEIIGVFVGPYTVAVGEDFLLMDDNICLYRAKAVYHSTSV